MISSWQKNFLFDGLTDDQLKVVEPFIYEVSYDSNSTIMAEGEEGTFVFIITEGSAVVYKGELQLSELHSGDLAGLMAIVDTKPRSATVIAGEHGACGYGLTRKSFNQLMSLGKDSIASTMLLNYLKYQQDTVRNTNEITLQEARARLEVERKRVLSGQFFAQMVLGLVVFTFSMGFLSEIAHQSVSTYASFTVLGVYGIWSYVFVRYSGLPPASFGLTMSNFRPALIMMMKATMIFIVLLFVLKFAMVYLLPEQFGQGILEWYDYENDGSVATWVVILLYSIHAVFQEFIARGCIQGGLMQFITGKWTNWKSIVLATLMFSSFHLMINVRFALISIVPSLFWGYLFYKEKNVLAVSISHILIGIIALFVLRITG